MARRAIVQLTTRQMESGSPISQIKAAAKNFMWSPSMVGTPQQITDIDALKFGFTLVT